MNMTHLLAFHRVASAGSFSLAARVSGISQPTLSTQVRSLEQTTGIELFRREGRRIRLTPAGEQLLRHTTRLAEALDAIERLLASTRAPVRGGLRLSADSAIHVIPILAELKRRSAGFKFSIRIDNSSSVTAQVLSGESDIGVMARPVSDPRLFSLQIRHDRIVLIVSAKDRLARRKRIRLADVAGRDLVVRERGSITREVLEEQILRSGITTGDVFDVATREAVGEAVAAGFGVGVVFASEAARDPRLVAVPIAGADFAVAEYAICLAERRNLGVVAQFLEAARSASRERNWL